MKADVHECDWWTSQLNDVNFNSPSVKDDDKKYVPL